VLFARAFYVEGLVQGVGFRHNTKLQALALGLCGSAVNLSDGRVYVEATGTEAALAALAKWLAHGPRFARVDRLTCSDLSADAALKISTIGAFTSA
jgi:acylphosphatase